MVAAARHARAPLRPSTDPGRRLSRRRRDKRRGGPAPPPAPVPASPPSGWSRQASLLAAAVAFVVYLPSLRGGFLYDDQSVILDNRGIRDLGALGQVIRSDPSRPVLSLTWALNYAAFGLEPWSYHLVNVAVHAGTAALAASLFVWMASRSGRAQPAPAALLGACLFAATPMAAETVAYVSSRSTALAACSCGQPPLAITALSVSRPRASAHLFLFVLAAAPRKTPRRCPPPAAPRLLLRGRAASLRGVGRARVHASSCPSRARARSPARRHRLVASPAALDRGVPGHAVAPILYLLRAVRSRSTPPSTRPPAGALGRPMRQLSSDGPCRGGGRGRGGLATALSEWPSPPHGWPPACCLVLDRPLKEMVVDHRAYWGPRGSRMPWGTSLWAARSRPRPRRAQCPVRRRRCPLPDRPGGSGRAWEAGVARAPGSSEAQRALGEAYAQRGDARAEEAFRAATALDPKDGRSWTNLGAFYVERGRLGDAEAAMRRASWAFPADARIHDNLAMILQALGREEDAAREYEAAVASRPALAQPRIPPGRHLESRGARAGPPCGGASRLEVDPREADVSHPVQQSWTGHDPARPPSWSTTTASASWRRPCRACSTRTSRWRSWSWTTAPVTAPTPSSSGSSGVGSS